MNHFYYAPVFTENGAIFVAKNGILNVVMGRTRREFFSMKSSLFYFVLVIVMRTKKSWEIIKILDGAPPLAAGEHWRDEWCRP